MIKNVPQYVNGLVSKLCWIVEEKWVSSSDVYAFFQMKSAFLHLKGAWGGVLWNFIERSGESNGQ